MQKLRGKIAVVTGASRGGGRGIALELGAAGATVYVTGRSTRAGAPAEYANFLAQGAMAKMPGSVEDTAEQVTAAGGKGIGVACDHTDVAQVHELFARVEREQGRIDLLVNNAWGGHETFTASALNSPFWEQSLDHWDSMMNKGARNHLLACREAAPLFVKQKSGLIITTSFWDRGNYLKGNLFYDVAKSTMNRIAFAVAEELKPHGVSSIALVPGWMRTEIILAAFKTDEAHWKEVPGMERTESPHYIGRAAVALASDPQVSSKTGTIQYVGALAKEYGFTDLDGRVIPPFEM